MENMKKIDKQIDRQIQKQIDKQMIEIDDREKERKIYKYIKYINI